MKSSKPLLFLTILFMASTAYLGYRLLSLKESTPPCTTCYSMDCESPFNSISMETALSMIRMYRDKQWTASNGLLPGNQNIQDARSVWFSLKTLKRFIYEIEAQSAAQCNDCSAQLGVRIYYGAYPDKVSMSNNPDLRDLPAEYAHLHSVLFVPTVREGNLDLDFFPGMMENCKPGSIEDVVDSKGVRSDKKSPILLLAPASNLDGSVMNHGHLVPPPFDATICTGAKLLRIADNLQGSCIPQ